MIMYVIMLCVIYVTSIYIPKLYPHLDIALYLVPLGMAFLLARLQRQVWQAATELQAVPAAAQVDSVVKTSFFFSGKNLWVFGCFVGNEKLERNF